MISRIAPTASRTVSAWRLWFGAPALAGCETWLNFGASPGLNWLLSTAASSALFVAFSQWRPVPVSWRRLSPLVLALLLAAGACITADASMDWLLVAGIFGSLAVALLRTTAASDRDVGMTELLFSPAIAGVAVTREARRRLGEGLSSTQAESSRPIRRGLALAAPVTLVFALLLSNADPLLASWRDSLVQALKDLSFLSRTACLALFGTVAFGSLSLALEAAPNSAAVTKPFRERQSPFGRTERLIVLWAVVGLFALFLALQVSHLFGNPAAVPGNGVTYAQSVHQGFAELTVVASLCGVLLIFLTKSSETGSLERRERCLSVVLILQTHLLLLSAFHRMALYEGVYGYTEMRLFVQVYIAIVGAALLALGSELLRLPDFNRMARRCALLVFLCVAGLTYWNHAAWIARANLARYERTGMLDTRYLTLTLGADAVPALLEALPRLPESMKREIRACLASVYLSDIRASEPRAWYEWSYRRSLLDSSLRRANLTILADGENSGVATYACYQ